MPPMKRQIFSASALPGSHEGISYAVPSCDHLAAGFEELRLSGIWL
jgi:hypothetical protein